MSLSEFLEHLNGGKTVITRRRKFKAGLLFNEWDKTFPKSEKVSHSKVTFHNRYGVTLAADMYVPKNADGKLSAIAVSGPFGAVKEQSSGLYAQTMAESGFLTISRKNRHYWYLRMGRIGNQRCRTGHKN